VPSRNKPGKQNGNAAGGSTAATLELHTDLAFQRWEWRLQRLGQAVLGLVVILALAGLFGGGPLGTARTATADGTLAASYERFARRGSHTRVRVDMRPARGGQHTLRVSRDYVQAVEIRQMTPSPSEVALRPEGTDLVFDLENAGAVEFDIWPARGGKLEAEFVLDGQSRLHLWQWVWF
jgi:hypothetical protein